MTGLGPGQHGLYHWRGRYDHAIRDRPLLCSRHLDEATFWWYCQQNGARVSISNFPMQYPAPPTDGRYICGTLAPEGASDVTWPPTLIQKIREVLPGYRFEIDKGLSYLDRPLELRDHILQVGQRQARALELFCVRDPVELLVHVVTITDRMQHFFWHCFDLEHPEYGSSPRTLVGNPIFEAYALAEASLQLLWEQSTWENIVVLSDHGMGASRVSFHTDVWLAEQGHACFRDDGRVDIERSLAYSGEEPECAVYVNKASRDGLGVDDAHYLDLVSSLRRGLLELMVPGTETPAFLRVFTQSELFTGIAAERGPDLVLLPANGVHPRPGNAEHIFDRAMRLYAGHRPEGVFIGFGADFTQSPFFADKPPVHIQDMFPMMCNLMDLPIPGGLWGTIPGDMLQRFRCRPRHVPDWDWPEQVRSLPMPQTDNQELLARLVELGYI